MPNYFTIDPVKGRELINLGSAIKEGGAGTIHRVTGKPGVVAKLYKDSSERPAYEKKVTAMLAARPNLQPISVHGRSYIQIAWPTAAIVDGTGAFCGFLMPEIDLNAATELENVLQKKRRERKKISNFFGARVLLAANLAALIAELHSLGHFMIDMKPENMRFYPGAWYMAVLDTDGFSINAGSSRIPSAQFSDGYIAPEAKAKTPDQLGIEQDHFALATIVFYLLTGVHPYQGVDQPGTNFPTDLQRRIYENLYAYGLAPHSKVRPSPASQHEYLEDSTRRLFDRSFGPLSSRPSAVEWRDHLKWLIQTKLLKCGKDPANHAHFSKGCGQCAFDGAISQLKATRPRTVPVQSNVSVLAGLQVSAPVQYVATTQQVRTSGPSPKQISLGILALVAVFLALRSLGQSAAPPQVAPFTHAEQTSTASSNSPFPTTNTAPEATPTGPSFSCTNPQKWAEQQVCTSASLSAQDQQMADLYKNMLATLTNPDKHMLKMVQRQWIAARNDCATSTDQSGCLSAIYSSRIAALLSGPVAAETPLASTPTQPTTSAEGQNSVANTASASDYDGQPQPAAPVEEPDACPLPSEPAAIDGTSATTDEMRAAHDAVVQFIAESDRYQACLLAKSNFPQSQSVRQKVESNQREKESAGTSFNEAVRAFKARTAQ